MAWSNSSLGRCRSCGATIVWMKTKAGKNMPCDSEVVSYVRGGKERVVTEYGEVVAATLTKLGAPDSERGYISHFATCANADKHRRR